jgi:glycosyltransferase involved in cell wall biosynthesis
MTNVLRVLHVHSGNLFGGVERVLVTLGGLRDVCPLMESHFALCFEGRLSAELTAAEVPFHPLGYARISRPLTVRRSRRALGSLLQSLRCDVVVTHSDWSRALFGSIVRRAQRPLVYWVHGTAPGPRWLQRWARRAMPDGVIYNSQFTAASTPRVNADVPTAVLYYPVAPPDRQTNADRIAVRRELGTPGAATVIVQVSRMEPAKGHLVHLEALAMLKELPEWICWQVGGPQRREETEYHEKLRRTANRLGIAHRIRFLGERSDVSRLLAAADIHCQPNTGPDAFGVVFIEALYARLPVVTTAIGAAAEIVDDSCGMLVPPGDSISLANVLRRLILDRDTRTRLGANGPEHAKRLCDPAIAMNRLRELLVCFAEGKRSVTSGT